jgi:RNA polymerase sigma factor (sigma-70 family)
MAARPISEVVQHLRRAVVLRDGDGPSDGQLLEDFLSRRDEAALAALVRRHGPMVWGTCRRVLRNHHDAEDAFQAAFLVLVRRAASIRPGERVGNWLHGVALRTALKARATAARRRERERQVSQLPEPAVACQDDRHDLRHLLDEELSRLPEKYRVLLVLCDLEGKTRKEVARQLGCPEGTVGGRLARARQLLAKRLTRRGLAVTGPVLATVLAHDSASAGVPASVASATVRSAVLVAAGQAATGLVSAQVVALTDGVLQAMLLRKLKVIAAVLLATTFAVGGLLTYGTALGGSGARQGKDETKPPAPAQEQPPQNRPLTLDEVNAKLLRDLGARFDVEVVGRTDRVVSGTELYFMDSNLDTAAVHAGLVKPGEKAVITVTVVRCPESGVGTTQHGVRSLPWEGTKEGYTALLLQRRTAKEAEKPRAEEPKGGELKLGVDFKGELAVSTPWKSYSTGRRDDPLPWGYATEVPVTLKAGQSVTVSATVVGKDRDVGVALIDPAGRVAGTIRETLPVPARLTVEEVNASGKYTVAVVSSQIGPFTVRVTGPSDEESDAKKLEERIKQLREDLADVEAKLKALKAKPGK